MKTGIRTVSLALFALMLVALTLMVPAPAPAQAPEGQTPSVAAELQGPAVVRFGFRDPEDLDRVAWDLDIWEVHPDERYAVARVSPEEALWLEDMGFQLVIDAEKTEWLGIQAPLDSRFYYYDDDYYNSYGRYVVDFLQDMNTNYPDLVELIDAGDAWQGLHGEYARDIWVLRITNEDPAYGPIEDKPVFYLMANIHAREVATPELAIRYIKWLVVGWDGSGGYGYDPDATWLVNHNTAYVLVMQNPDGHRVNEANTGAYRRKNMDNDDGCNDPGSWGVDLNRNHSFLWGCCGGSSGSPCSETYRGPFRMSEPETEAFQNHFYSVMLDQNGPNGDDEYPPAAPDDATGIFISLHQYADEILWPWAHTQSPAPNDAQLTTIARKFAHFNGYYPSGFLYTVDGSTDEWTYGKFGIASFTYEIGANYGSCSGFFPPYGCVDGIDGMPRSYWDENGPSFIYAHKIARTPYMTVYGPDTQNVAVSPDTVPAGTPVDLSANIADHRYGGDPLQPIVGAEYFVDAPGDDGTGIAMNASDGSWGGLSENVEAVVNTAGLAAGQHYILVHGLNDDGDWGPFTAVFLNIEESSNTMHVGNIKMRWRSIDTRYQANALLPVEDQDGNRLAGATVTAEWTLPNGATGTRVAVTNSRGLAGFAVRSPFTGEYQICVTDVTLAGYVYDPNQNVETCETIQVP